ncbi:MAG: diaminopimelate epimerase [Syntrophomonadaceae bacterium]|nr:diaminopimelate epimerase [Syntrophomonadaceae bacterium]
MQFLKVHGIGNDFILIDRLQTSEEKNWPELARQMCDRHFGVGADGLVLILPSTTADLCMRVFNPDGSEAEMCGNAIRCVARYVYQNKLVAGIFIRVETLAGLRVPEVILDGQGQCKGVKVDMGEPILDPVRIPMSVVSEKIVNYPLQFSGGELMITAVSMGNPHCITYVSDLEKVPFYEWGPRLETHPLFPQKTNVEFVEVINPQEVRMRVWERGAGETLACGTGACAVGVASYLNGLTERKITVHLPGGDLQIEWAENGHVYMTGPAQEIFNGIWLL